MASETPLCETTDSGTVIVYELRVRGLDQRLDTMAYIVEKDACFLSPNTKLADRGRAAQLDDQQLAGAFASAIMPTLRKRHGDGVALMVDRYEMAPTGPALAKLLARIRHDTSVVRARLRERNFAPNCPPLILASDLIR